VDPLIAILIAVYIIYSAWQIGGDSVHLLMDRELPDEQKNEIREIARRHPEVRGLHELRMRRSGQTYIIQLHLELDEGMSLARAHEISDDVEGEIMRVFPGSDVLIHQDPVSPA
jgi:ferrous-iron efflux pump FieF